MSTPVPQARPELESCLAVEFPGSHLRRLVGDASTRIFLRLHLPDGGTRVVMDYGRPFEGETDDQRLARVFRAGSLRVADIERAFPETGCLMLEDLGDRTLQRALCEDGVTAERRERLYESAVDLAVAVATRGSEALAASERPRSLALDAERFRFEMDFFLEHYVAGLLGQAPSAALSEALRSLAEAAARTPARVLCHRDFHSRNLMVLDDGALAMVDIQDARWGPDTYDLASLLRDAYVDIDDGLVGRMIERYRRAMAGAIEPRGLEDRFEQVAAQRMIKALGTFGFQLHVRRNARYRDAAARMRGRLDRVLAASPATTRLHGLLADCGVF